MAIVSGYEPAPYLILGYNQSMDRSDDKRDGGGDPPTVRTEPRFSSRVSGTNSADVLVAPRAALTADAALNGYPSGAVYPSPDAAFTMAPSAPSKVSLVPPPASLAFDARPMPSPVPLSASLGDKPEPLPEARQAPASQPPGKNFKRFAVKAMKFAGYAAAGWLALVLFLIFAYRFVNPPMSSLMLQQRLFGEDVTQDWVAMEAISPQIVRAVVLSEDGRFCQHHGVDFVAMQWAIEHAGGGPPRGASTISMQVTKNLFLWPSKSYVRKAIEIPLTYAIELVWPKRRIMEVYLNIAEWGPGIFGVEAASRFHFNKAASRLNEREAAQLAVALPNPYARDPGDPGPRTQRLAGDIQGRMRGASPAQTACVLRPRLAR